MNNDVQPAARRIWVFIEQHEGTPHPVSWELLGAAGRLAADLPGASIEAVIAGHQIAPLASLAFSYGATHVYLLDHPALAVYRNHPYAQVISQLIHAYQPEIFLIGATTLGRDLAGAIATRVGAGLTADCTELSIEPQQHILAATRPTFGGNLMATILCRHHRPQMVTVRPRVFPLPQPVAGAHGELVVVPVDLCEADIPVKRLCLIRAAERPAIDYAEIVIAGGRGVGGPDGFALLEELAAALGGVVGASRPVVDAGWIDADRQIGQTGKTVRPRLYIAAGISGAIQHRVGIRGADRILAINSDPHAPIFQIADLGIVGDLFIVIPELIRQIRQTPKRIFACHAD